MIQVMIVEDEPAIARGLSLMISRNYPDFQVIGTAGNGKEGVQKILALTPDLIFADINMPVMNGLIERAGYDPPGSGSRFFYKVCDPDRIRGI